MAITAERIDDDRSEVPGAPPVPGQAFRRYRGEEDIEHFVEVYNNCRQVDGFDWVMTMEKLRNEYTNMVNFDPAQDLILAEVDGKVVGYARINWFLENEGTLVYKHFELVVPAWRGKGIWRALRDHNERRARQLAATHPRGPKAMSCWVSETERDLIALLEDEGHTPARYFHEMLRDLSEPIGEHPLPEGLEVRPVTPAQHRTIFEGQWEASMDHWGWRKMEEVDFRNLIGSPNFQPDLWMVAWDGGAWAGVVMSWSDEKENETHGRRWGYPDDIAVGRPYRRRGLARALLSRSLALLRDRGMTHANLGVDTENPNEAFNLYTGLGFRRYKLHYIYRKSLE